MYFLIFSFRQTDLDLHLSDKGSKKVEEDMGYIKLQVKLVPKTQEEKEQVSLCKCAEMVHVMCKNSPLINPIALREAKIVYNFGLSECNRVNVVKVNRYNVRDRNTSVSIPDIVSVLPFSFLALFTIGGVKKRICSSEEP